MKTIALAGILLAAPLTVHATEPVEREVVPASENAALVYWLGWTSLAEHLPVLKYADYTTEGLVVPGDRTEEEILAALEAADYGIEVIIHASKMEHCDFGSRPELSVDPDREYTDFHIRVARESAKLLAVDAGRHFEMNWSEPAVERIVTVFRLAEHLGRDQTVMPSLVGATVFDLAAEYTAEFQGKLSAEHRRMIADALGRYSDEDPFRLAASVRADSAASARALAKRIQAREMDEWSMRDTGLDGTLACVQAKQNSLLSRTKVSRLARARLVRDALRISEVGEALAESWGDPSAIESLVDEVYAGEHGAFVQRTTGLYGKLRQVDYSSRAKLNALRAWANGESETLELPEEATR